jgi:hypothetical protein
VAKRLARHFTFGRSRVLTPVRCGFFSEVSPHHHIVICLISPIGECWVSISLCTFLPHPSTPYPSRIWLKRLWKASAGGNERCILSFHSLLLLRFGHHHGTTFVSSAKPNQDPVKNLRKLVRSFPPHKIFHFLFARLVLLFFLVISVGTKFVFKRASSMR